MRFRTKLATLASIEALALGVGLATATAGTPAASSISYKLGLGSPIARPLRGSSMVLPGWVLRNLRAQISTQPATRPRTR